MGCCQSFFYSCKWQLQLFRKLSDRLVHCHRPVIGFQEDLLSALLKSRFYGAIGQLICCLRPLNQLLDPINFFQIFIYFGQRLCQCQEPVDSSGHRIQVDLIPSLQYLILPFLQSPFFHHTGAKTADMLHIHGVHGASIWVHADQISLLFDKFIQTLHLPSSFMP